MYSAAVDENLRLCARGGVHADRCCCRTKLNLLLVKTLHFRVVLLKLLFCGCHCQSQNQAFILKKQDQSPEQPIGVALPCLDQRFGPLFSVKWTRSSEVGHDLTLRSLCVPAASSASEKAVFHRSAVTFLSSEVQQEVARV